MSRGTWVSNSESLINFVYRTITFYGQTFQNIRLYIRFITFRRIRNFVQLNPTTPNIQRFRTLTYARFGLIPFRSPLLWKSLLFSIPKVTKMFQFTSLASTAYFIQLKMSWHYPKRVSPFRNLRIKTCLAAPRSLSQLSTSFIAS